MIRNHGLKDRNNCEIFGYNSRLDTIQAAIANYKIKNKLDNITKKRISNAKKLDSFFKKIPDVFHPKREKKFHEVFHLYQINIDKRDKLMKFLNKNNIDAKIHYPIPIHLQRAAKYLGYKKGDFPLAEKIAKTTLSLPVHEFITQRDLNKIGFLVKKFFT